MKKIRAGKWLRCGCCGDDFKTWTGYVDQDQDKDYGICQGCQDDAATRYQQTLDDMIQKVRGALRPETLAKFDAKTREQQEGFVLSALDKGIISWKIGG